MENFLKKLKLVVGANYTPDSSCIKCADKIIEHEFSVLGSTPAIIEYGMTCKGFEGHFFSNPQHNYIDTRKKADEVAPDYAKTMKEAEELANLFVDGYKPIPWHLDIITGYLYDLVWHTEVPVAKIPGVDAKTPSDFSRAHNLLTLAQAYKLTKDKKYRNHLASQLLDWIAVNPPYYGPAWRNGMNVSIRLTNIICALALIDLDLNDPLDYRFTKLVKDLIILHIRYVAMTMELKEEHNHLIAEACALTFATALFSDAKTTQALPLENLSYERVCWFLIDKQIDHQINEDGFDFERSISYHAYVLEMLLYPTLHACRLNGCKTAEDCRAFLTQPGRITKGSFEKLKKATKVLCMLTQPDGNIPYISDNDAGRYIEWEAREKHPADMRSLCCTLAVLFDDANLVPPSSRESDFIASKAFFDDAKPLKSTFNPFSSAFIYSGLTIMAKDDFHSVFRSGGERKICEIGHSHNDQLSFTLCAMGKSFIVDSGTYTYTGDKDWRRKTKSVFAHNTIAVDKEEPDVRIAISMFGEVELGAFTSLVNFSQDITSLVEFKKTENSVSCTGSHNGYERLEDKITIERTLTYTDKKLTVLDKIIRENESKKEGEITERFIANSDAKVYLKDNKAFIEMDGKTIKISSKKGYFRTEKAFHSINYGQRKDTTAVVVVLPRDCEENQIEIKW